MSLPTCSSCGATEGVTNCADSKLFCWNCIRDYLDSTCPGCSRKNTIELEAREDGVIERWCNDCESAYESGPYDQI